MTTPPYNGILHFKEQVTLYVLIWGDCQDVLLSESTVVIHCTTIWVLKRKISLYVIEIFWKDTKATVTSGMSLKKRYWGLEV